MSTMLIVDALITNRARVLGEDGDAALALEVVRVHDPLGDHLVLAERARLPEEPKSTRVVLPWSTWATIAMLRSFIGFSEEAGRRGRRGPGRESDGNATAREFALVPVELCGAIHERPMEGKGAGALAVRP